MKTIIEYFLESLEIPYTGLFAKKLYYEHPHRYNMYGLKKMLDVYGVKTLGIRVESKDLSSLNYPCILHTYSDFVIGMGCEKEKITYLQNGKTTTVSHEVFMKTWTGNALVVEETTEAEEPEYKKHHVEEMLEMVNTYCIPIMLAFSSLIGIAKQIRTMDLFPIIGILLSAIGVFVCALLMQKQLLGESHYGDRVCSLFRHADCNSILDGPKAKIFGISWSEVGMGYFTATILLLSLYNESIGAVSIINWIAMFYGIWSIRYQWHIAKSWCALCLISQIIIWTMGIVAFISYMNAPFVCCLVCGLLTCIVYAITIIAVHHYAKAHTTKKERIRAIQQYRALKANGIVAKTLIESRDYFKTSFDDSSIVFGNPDAKICVTILSNPHCNPCARMHKHVEKLLNLSGDEICVQYIFSSFSEKLEDSSRYLIYCYFEYERNESLRKFTLWYSKEKYDYERIINNNDSRIHTQKIEEEMDRHKEWRNRTSLIETPTVLVNGYKCPEEYLLEDLAMIVDSSISKKNILQDISGRSTTLLGAEQLSAEETV